MVYSLRCLIIASVTWPGLSVVEGPADCVCMLQARRELTTLAEEETYDIIVVGAGLMGSVVASELAERLPGQRLLLLEAGEASQRDLGGTKVPADYRNGQWEEWPDVGLNLTMYDVPGNYIGMQCWAGTCDHSFNFEQVPFYQCKVLGGCGVMNGALMQFPNPHMFEAWPEGWQFKDLESAFDEVKKIENIVDAPSDDGLHYGEQAGSNFFSDVLKHAGFKRDSTTYPRANTYGIPYVTAENGERMSTARKYLPKAMQSTNFELRLESEATEIIFDGSLAIGIRYKHAGQERVASLSRHGLLVLSAGAFNTPRLLLASGVGPGRQLPNYAVGRGLQDKTSTSATYEVPPGTVLEGVTFDPPSEDLLQQYKNTRSGALAQYGPTLAGYIKDTLTNDTRIDFDVEVFVTCPDPPKQFTVWFVLMRPLCSQGSFTVEGPQNNIVMEHDQLHFGCDGDRQRVERAVDLITTNMEALGARRLDLDMSTHVMNHWVGSCALGQCVDPANLLVRNTSNVAVADASLVPDQIWTHPAFTLEAVAHKAGWMLAGPRKGAK